ncbi:hypothetical protein [Intrasporangium mesophilum]
MLSQNFVEFAASAAAARGRPVVEVERVTREGVATGLDELPLDELDTLVIISFDSDRTDQVASASEVAALRGFLSVPGNVAFGGLHHEVGVGDDADGDRRMAVQVAEHEHHGDRTLPPRQGFGRYGRSLLAGLDVPVDNRFGLRPAVEPDGSPAAILPELDRDRLGLLAGVPHFNLHPHLPHIERHGSAVTGMEVLARQRVDPDAPPHPEAADVFDALLQSRPGLFAGDLLVGDATLFSATNGGAESLRRLWRNLLDRQVS